MALSNHASFMVIAHLTAFGEERGLAPIAAAGLVSAMLGVSLVSRLSIGQLSNRWSPYQVLLAMSILLALGVVCLANAQGRIPIGLGIIAIGLAFGGYLPGYAILVRELFPAAQAGRRIAEIYFFAFVAAGIGSWTSGWLRDLSGTYILPFWTAAASASLGAALLLQLRGRLQSPK
jgi:predicted MFS family arabinose efflux permease